MSWPLRPTKWDDRSIEHLRLSRAAGKSTGQIVRELAEMGYELNRNAVIGKAHRCGFATPNAPGPRVEQRRLRVDKPVRLSGLAEDSTVRNIVRERPPPEELSANATRAFGTPVTLIDLEPHHCRWIINDPRDGAMFCAATVVTGAPYCTEHCRCAYVPYFSRAARAEARRAA